MIEKPNEAEMVIKFLEEKNYEKLFSNGYCFHFALCSANRGIGTLHKINYKSCEGMAHVFVITRENKAFDRLGFRTVDSLCSEFPNTHSHEIATPEEIKDKIREITIRRNLSPATCDRIFEAAEIAISGCFSCMISSPPTVKNTPD